jgi:hypothetical protein
MEPHGVPGDACHRVRKTLRQTAKCAALPGATTHTANTPRQPIQAVLHLNTPHLSTPVTVGHSLIDLGAQTAHRHTGAQT